MSSGPAKDPTRSPPAETPEVGDQLRTSSNVGTPPLRSDEHGERACARAEVESWRRTELRTMGRDVLAGGRAVARGAGGLDCAARSEASNLSPVRKCVCCVLCLFVLCVLHL